MTPLTLILRKCVAAYTYGNETKINHHLFMDDLLIQSVRIFGNEI